MFSFFFKFKICPVFVGWRLSRLFRQGKRRGRGQGGGRTRVVNNIDFWYVYRHVLSQSVRREKNRKKISDSSWSFFYGSVVGLFPPPKKSHLAFRLRVSPSLLSSGLSDRQVRAGVLNLFRTHFTILPDAPQSIPCAHWEGEEDTLSS